MAQRTLKVHRLARTMLDGLSEAERQRIVDAASALLRSEPQDWPQDQAILLSGDKPLYLLRVPPDLCALVVPADGALELRYAGYEETLQHLAASRRNGAGG